MQHDEMIWQVINHQFCSFKTTIGSALSEQHTDFCRNPYSITGLCNKSSCPLANSNYATIREHNGQISLYIKTIERCHSPKNTWEKIYLSRNYTKALNQLNDYLKYYPKNIQHRNKQRLTKIHQYLLRMRKLSLNQRNGKKARSVRVHRKIEQREERREIKALVAAKIESKIEVELVERLKKGTYGDIHNFPEAPYRKALEEMTTTKEEEEEDEEMETEEEVEEEEGEIEYVEDLNEEEEDEEDEEDDVEDLEYMGDGRWEHAADNDDDDDESDSEEDSSSGDDDDDDNDGNDEEDDESDGDDDDSKPSSKDDKKRKPKTTWSNKKQSKQQPRIEIEYEQEEEEEEVEDNDKVTTSSSSISATTTTTTPPTQAATGMAW